MDERVGEDEEEILSYIKSKGEKGARWTDLTNEFEKGKNWSHGKFCNHWNNIKKTHIKKTKDPKTGRPRYIIKEKFEELAEKALLKTDISEHRLNSIAIRRSRLEKAAENVERQYLASRLRGSVDYVGRKVDEEAKKELRKRKPKMSAEMSDLMGTLGEALMREQKDFKKGFSHFLERITIKASFAEEEGPPALTDEDIYKLFVLVMPKLVSSYTGQERKKSLHLIITFSETEEKRSVTSAKTTV
jgi:hypothetical protein